MGNWRNCVGIYGQEHVQRALEVAAAGGHNVVLNRCSTPKSGSAYVRPARLRQDAARALHAVHPPAHDPDRGAERHAHLLRGRHTQWPGNVPLIRHRPFRAPHHTISHAGLVGGGQWPRPGETHACGGAGVSLAHRGALFQAEPQFSRRDAGVRATRAGGAAATAGPCGQDRHHQPRAGQPDLPGQLHARWSSKPMSLWILWRPGARLYVQPDAHQPLPRYAGGSPARCWTGSTSTSKSPRPVSEALVDRIDNERRGEPSAAIRAHVEAARARQSARFANVKDGQGASLTTNADTPALAPKRSAGASVGPPRCAITARWTRPAASSWARSCSGCGRAMNLSARAYHRVLKLARTIADLAGSERIQPAHIAMSIPGSTAIQYRPRRME